MNRKYKIVLIVVLVCLGFSFFLTTLARYSSSNVWNYYLESQGFYFSSDNLSNDQVNVDTFGMVEVFILILKIFLIMI